MENTVYWGMDKPQADRVCFGGPKGTTCGVIEYSNGAMANFSVRLRRASPLRELTETTAYASDNRICGIDDDGAFCFGFSGSAPTSVQVPVSGIISNIAAYGHHNCAVIDGELSCWGMVPNSGLLPSFQKKIEDIKFSRLDLCSKNAGGVSRCDSLVYGWFPQTKPGEFSTKYEIYSQAISREGDYYCGVKLSNNLIECRNYRTGNILAPNLTIGLTDIKKLVQGRTINSPVGSIIETCAIHGSPQTFSCWEPRRKQLQTFPVEQVTAAAIGGAYGTSRFACVIADLKVRCFGDNSNGELEIPEIKKPTQLVAADNIVCAFDEANTNPEVKCWGKGTSAAPTPHIISPSGISASKYTICVKEGQTTILCAGEKISRKRRQS